MKILLKGGLVKATAPRELELPFDGPATREALLAALAAAVPGVQRYLSMSAETGRAPSLLVLAGGNWVYAGDLVAEDATVEVHPPIAGGAPLP